MLKLEVATIKGLYEKDKYSINEIAEKLNIPFWKLYAFMVSSNIERRHGSEVNYLTNRLKGQFELKSNLGITEEKLKIAGIMLYWAEGTLKGQTVDFVNSNPDMVKIFLRFLRQICGIDERRLRLYLYTYPNLELEKTKIYWKNITGIPLKQFTKPYIRDGNLNISKRKLPYGLVHIRYNDKKLLETIASWIKDYRDNILIWTGTQVAKGGRLCNRSVLPKGRM